MRIRRRKTFVTVMLAADLRNGDQLSDPAWHNRAGEGTQRGTDSAGLHLNPNTLSFARWGQGGENFPDCVRAGETRSDTPQ